MQRDRGERTGQSGELEEKNNLKEKARQKIRDLEEKKKQKQTCTHSKCPQQHQ